jgi:hypothetical protein
MPDHQITRRPLTPTAAELFEALERAVKTALVKLSLHPHYADDAAQLRAVLARVEENRDVVLAALPPPAVVPKKQKTRAS